jgi:integrase/recombinase XerD
VKQLAAGGKKNEEKTMAAKKKNEGKGGVGGGSREFNELYEYAELAERSELETMQRKYIRWMISHNYSSKTIETQGSILSRFVEWCHERGLLRPQEITRDILEHYQEQLTRSRKYTGESYSAGYLNKNLSVIRGLFRWLAKNRHILYNPASELELPRLAARIPRNVLNMAEVEAVMMQVDLSSFLGLRNRAILETLYSTGIRRSELCMLKCKDIFVDTGVVLVREGKGRKDRMTPIGERALAWIEKYKSDLRPRLVKEPDEGALFLSIRGKPLIAGNLSVLVSDYVKAAGIDKEGSCHIFRHTMATLMLDNGADIRYIQQILGHANLNTTQIYTQVSIKKLKEVHSTTHPGAQLKPNSLKQETRGSRKPGSS